MRHSRLRPWLLVVSAAGVLTLVLTSACSQQQEGERCDMNNGVSGGDSDCNSGLVCTAAKDLGTDTDRCCPQDRSQSTVAPCIVSSSTITQDASPPATDGSTSTTDSSTTDSGSDTGTDTGTDSGSSDAADSG